MIATQAEFLKTIQIQYVLQARYKVFTILQVVEVLHPYDIFQSYLLQEDTVQEYWWEILQLPWVHVGFFNHQRDQRMCVEFDSGLPWYGGLRCGADWLEIGLLHWLILVEAAGESEVNENGMDPHKPDLLGLYRDLIGYLRHIS